METFPLITSISEDELIAACQFKFKKISSHRNLEIQDMMPITSNLTTYLVITTLYIKVSGAEYQCNTFDELFAITGYEKNSQSVRLIITKFPIIEGDHILDRKISNAIINTSINSDDVFIRCYKSKNEMHCYKVNLFSYLFSGNLLDVLDENFGEFEIFDEQNTWYLRLSDESPFLFLSVSKELETVLLNTSQDLCLKIPPNFRYSF